MGWPQTISAEIFKYVNHCYNTRYQDKQALYVSKTKLEITDRALAHHGAINWNILPDYSKSAPSLNVVLNQ